MPLYFVVQGDSSCIRKICPAADPSFDIMNAPHSRPDTPTQLMVCEELPRNQNAQSEPPVWPPNDRKRHASHRHGLGLYNHRPREVYATKEPLRQ